MKRVISGDPRPYEQTHNFNLKNAEQDDNQGDSSLLKHGLRRQSLAANDMYYGVSLIPLYFRVYQLFFTGQEL